MAVFVDLAGGRDVTIVDDTDWTTPAAELLPNSDPATQPITSDAEASRADTSGDFAIPFGVSDFTVELWVYYTAANDGTNKWFVSRHGTSVTRDWEVRQPGDTGRNVRFAILGSDGTAVIQDLTIAATAAAWTHCVFTFKSSLGIAPVAGRVINAYKNGSLDSTVTVGSGVTMTRPTLTTPQFTIGGSASASLGAATLAYVAKVAIYHRELTAGEVLDHYEAMTT